MTTSGIKAPLTSEKEIQAEWCTELWCDCPGCREYVNLAEVDDFFTDRPSLQPGEHTEGVDVECPNCGHEFTVTAY